MERRIKTHRGELSFELEYKRVKNLNLRIKPDGSVHISAPPRAPLSVIDSFVISKADLVFDAIERFARRAKEQGSFEYLNGDSLRIFGRELKILLSKSSKNETRIEGDELILSLTDPDSLDMRARAVKRFCDCEVRRVVLELCDKVYPLFERRGIAYPEIKFRNMKTRWGSCHTKKHILTFSYSLICAPVSSIEYVVMHEFTHFIHPDHSAAFHSEMARLMPDYKARKRDLV